MYGTGVSSQITADEASKGVDVLIQTKDKYNNNITEEGESTVIFDQLEIPTMFCSRGISGVGN